MNANTSTTFPTTSAQKRNLASEHPEIAKRLRDKLKAWGSELTPPGLTTGRMAPTWDDYYDHYLEGKTVTGPPGNKGRDPKTNPRREKQKAQE